MWLIFVESVIYIELLPYTAFFFFIFFSSYNYYYDICLEAGNATCPKILQKMYFFYTFGNICDDFNKMKYTQTCHDYKLATERIFSIYLKI